MAGAPPAAPNRKTRSIGVLPVLAGTETPIRRQRRKKAKHANTAAVATITNSWVEETLSGSLLLAFLSYSNWNAAGTHTATSGITVTPPAGWTSVGVIHSNDAPSSVSLRIYKIENAAERSGDEAFAFDANIRRAELELMEFRGVAHAAAQDVFKSASGFSTRPDTDFSAATDVANPKQLVIGAVAARTLDRSIKPDDFPEGWFPFKDILDGPYRSVGREDYWLNMAVARRIALTSSTQRLFASYDQTTQEDDAKSRWVAALVTFKARERSAAGDKDFYVVDNEDAADTHGLYSIDYDQVDTGAWTRFGGLVASRGSVDDRPLAMAYGMGGLLLTSTDVIGGAGQPARGLFQWDGDTLIRINRSPLARCLAVHRGRFYAGGTRERPNDLFWSAVGDQTTWDMDKWFTPIGSDGEAILDVASVSDGLLIAKRDSLHLFVGPASGPQVAELPGGGGMKGRCICPIPGGAVVASANHIWLWGGGAPRLISRALDDWWVNPDRKFAYTAYVNGLVYLLGADEDTCAVYDTATQAWWVDKPPEKLRTILSKDWRELIGGVDNSATRFVMFQRNPGSARTRDAGVAQVFEAWTQELMFGSPSRPTTARHLYVTYRKRNYQAGHPPLVVTPVFDGVTYNARNITEVHPVSGDVLADGSHTIRLDVGVKEATAQRKAQFQFRYDAVAGNTTVFDIEAVEFVYDIEEER